MPALPSPALPGPPWRLWAARAAAWALWLGGWLVLGHLGHQHQPLLAGGLAPLALWWLASALAQAGWRRWPPGARALRGSLGLAAALLLLAVWRLPQAAGGLWLVAAAWGGLAASASQVVRGLRPAGRAGAQSPVWPALAGAAAAGLLAWPDGPLGQAGGGEGAALALVPGLAAGLLFALVPARLARPGACGAGVYGPALPAGPRSAARPWALRAASWAMLPMMASLAPMADWCARLPWPAGAGSALHLGAMLLPAAVLAWRRPSAPRPWLGLIRGLLVLGGLALLWPGIAGLVLASLLHGLAWSLAWGLGLLGAGTALAQPGPAPPPRPMAALAAPLGTAAALLLLGLALHQAGPAALVAVHAALAACGLADLGPRRQPAPAGPVAWRPRPG